MKQKKHVLLRRIDIGSDVVGIAAAAIALMSAIEDPAHPSVTMGASLVVIASVLSSRIVRWMDQRPSSGDPDPAS